MTNQTEDKLPTEPTTQQRVGAVVRTLGSFRIALGALLVGGLAGLLWPPLLYIGAVSFYVGVLYVAWTRAEVLGRKQLTLDEKETKQEMHQRNKEEGE